VRKRQINVRPEGNETYCYDFNTIWKNGSQENGKGCASSKYCVGSQADQCEALNKTKNGNINYECSIHCCDSHAFV
jgi:hypothetical protein